MAEAEIEAVSVVAPAVEGEEERREDAVGGRRMTEEEVEESVRAHAGSSIAETADELKSIDISTKRRPGHSAAYSTASEELGRSVVEGGRMEAVGEDLQSLLGRAREGFSMMRAFGSALSTQIDTSSGSAEAIVRLKANFAPLLDRIGQLLEEFHCAINLGRAVKPTEAGGNPTGIFANNEEGSKAKRRTRTWGKDTKGCLGLGEVQTTIQLPTMMEQMTPFNVISIACGCEHTLMVTDTGRLFSCGGGSFGQLGVGNDRSAHTPAMVKALQRTDLVAVAAGDYHSMAMTAQGDVFSWGSMFEQKKSRIFAASEPKLVYDIGKDVSCGPASAISAGSNHAAIITSYGKLLLWGKGVDGQLGDGKWASSPAPRESEFLSSYSLVCVGCGEGHTVTMGKTEKGDLSILVFGSNKKGQLGIGSKVGQGSPVPIDHRIILRSLKEEAAEREEEEEVPEARLLSWAGKGASRKAKGVSISCRGNTSSMVFSDGTVYAWGDNKYGQCAQGDTKDQLYPAKVLSLPRSLHVKELALGNRHALALTEVGELYGWGRGSAVGLGERSHKKSLYEARQIETISNVQSIASGENHSAAVEVEGSFLFALAHPLQSTIATPNALAENAADLTIPRL